MRVSLKKMLAVAVAGTMGSLIGAMVTMGLPSASWALDPIQGKVGPQVLNDGSQGSLRQGRDATAIVQEGHARFAEAALRGNTYTCSNPAGSAVTTQSGLSVTTPALVVWNPIGSGVMVALNTVTATYTSVTSTTTFILAVSTGPQSAPATVTNGNLFNNKIGSAILGQAQCYRVSTLQAAPLAIRYFGVAGTGNGVAGMASSFGTVVDHVDGEVILAPGELATIQTSSAATILSSISFEEFPGTY